MLRRAEFLNILHLTVMSIFLVSSLACKKLQPVGSNAKGSGQGIEAVSQEPITIDEIARQCFVIVEQGKSELGKYADEWLNICEEIAALPTQPPETQMIALDRKCEQKVVAFEQAQNTGITNDKAQRMISIFRANCHLLVL